jgi:hypothetical protein
MQHEEPPRAVSPARARAEELATDVRTLLTSVGATDAEIEQIRPRENQGKEAFVYWGTLGEGTTKALLKALGGRP